jgi:hypothetical protein
LANLNDQVILGILREIYEVSLICQTRTHIWAGLVPDIMQGKFLREHHDIDGFTLNLWDIRLRLDELFSQRGFTVTYMEDFHIMRLDRDDAHVGLNPLIVDSDTAMWKHIGDDGTLYFPRRWLSEDPCSFYDTKAYVSGVEFEYSIKSHPELLSPIWKNREKDQQTLQWLSGILRERGISATDILSEVWSYNPFWVKKGYPEYRKPIIPMDLNT